MDDRFIDKHILKEISKEHELAVPASIDIRLNIAYRVIREKSTISQPKKTWPNKKIIVAACLVLVILAGISTTPVIAKRIPIIQEIGNSLKRIDWFNDNYLSNTQAMDITQSDQGIDIHLEGVVYDDSSLKFIYTLTSEQKLQWGVQIGKNSLKINGKNILPDKYKILSDDVKMSENGDKIEKYAVITTYDVSDLTMNDEVDIDWTINEIHTWDKNYAHGKWRFNFRSSKSALKSESKVVDANYTLYEKEGYKLTIGQIIFTPTEVKIVTVRDAKLSADLSSALKDFENNPNDPEIRERFEQLQNISQQLDLWGNNPVKISDELGNEFKPIISSGDSGRSMYLFRPVTKIPEKIIFTPTDYVHQIKSEFLYWDKNYEDVPLKDIKTPFEYIQGDNMSIVINSISIKGSIAKVNATFKGDFIASRVGNYSIAILPQGIKTPPNGINYQQFMEKFNSINKTDYHSYYEQATAASNTFEFYYELKSNQEYFLRFMKIPPGLFLKANQRTLDIK